MARSLEQVLQEQIGQLVLANANLTAQLEAVSEECERLRAAEQKQKLAPVN